jgi:hypothetical protein
VIGFYLNPLPGGKRNPFLAANPSGTAPAPLPEAKIILALTKGIPYSSMKIIDRGLIWPFWNTASQPTT